MGQSPGWCSIRYRLRPVDGKKQVVGGPFSPPRGVRTCVGVRSVQASQLLGTRTTGCGRLLSCRSERIDVASSFPYTEALDGPREGGLDGRIHQEGRAVHYHAIG